MNLETKKCVAVIEWIKVKRKSGETTYVLNNNYYL